VAVAALMRSVSAGLNVTYDRFNFFDQRDPYEREDFPGAEQIVVRPWRGRYGLAVVYSILVCLGAGRKKLKWKL
jgi:hypothetical protein